MVFGIETVITSLICLLATPPPANLRISISHGTGSVLEILSGMNLRIHTRKSYSYQTFPKCWHLSLQESIRPSWYPGTLHADKTQKKKNIIFIPLHNDLRTLLPLASPKQLPNLKRMKHSIINQIAINWKNFSHDLGCSHLPTYWFRWSTSK